MHKKYAKTISCLLAALLLTGCQATPSSVKNKAKDYTNSKDITTGKEEFVSVDHLLDNMDSLLKASYQNMILADTIRIEQLNLSLNYSLKILKIWQHQKM